MGAPDPPSSQEARALPQNALKTPSEGAVWAASCPQQARKKGHEAGRGAATERTPRAPGTLLGEASSTEEGPRGTGAPFLVGPMALGVWL